MRIQYLCLPFYFYITSNFQTNYTLLKLLKLDKSNMKQGKRMKKKRVFEETIVYNSFSP